MKKFDKTDIQICISLFAQPEMTIMQIEEELKVGKKEILSRVRVLREAGMISNRTHIALDKVFPKFSICKIIVQSDVAEEYSDMLYEDNPFDQIIEVKPKRRFDGKADLVYYALIYGHSSKDIKNRIKGIKIMDVWSKRITIEVSKGMQFIQSRGSQCLTLTEDDFIPQNFSGKK